MKRKNQVITVFFKEFEALEKYKRIIEHRDVSKEELFAEFEDLYSSYMSLLNDVVKITEVGDKSLRKLLKAKEKIELLNDKLSESEKNMKELNAILMFYINSTEKQNSDTSH